jgi:hypothetical protein
MSSYLTPPPTSTISKLEDSNLFPKEYPMTLFIHKTDDFPKIVRYGSQALIPKPGGMPEQPPGTGKGKKQMAAGSSNRILAVSSDSKVAFRIIYVDPDSPRSISVGLKRGGGKRSTPCELVNKRWGDVEVGFITNGVHLG